MCTFWLLASPANRLGPALLFIEQVSKLATVPLMCSTILRRFTNFQTCAVRITLLRTVQSSDNDHNTKKKSLTAALKSVEDSLMLSLITIYSCPIWSKFLDGACIYKLFPPRSSSRSSRGSRKSTTSPNSDNSNFSPTTILSTIVTHFKEGNLHACRALICNLNKYQVIALGSFTFNNIGNATTDIKI